MRLRTCLAVTLTARPNARVTLVLSSPRKAESSPSTLTVATSSAPFACIPRRFYTDNGNGTVGLQH